MKLKIQDLYNVSYKALGVVDDKGKLSSINHDKKTFLDKIASNLSISRDLFDLTKEPAHENFERFYRQNYKKISDYYNMDNKSLGSRWIDLSGFKSFTDTLPNLEIDLDKNPKLFGWAFKFVCDSVPDTSSENEKFAFFSKLFPKNGLDKALKNYLEVFLDSGYYVGGENSHKVNNHFAETRGLEVFVPMKASLIKAFYSIEKERKDPKAKLDVLRMGMSVHGFGNLNKVAWHCATRAFEVVLEDTKNFEKAKEYVLQPRIVNPNFYKSYDTEMKRWINSRAKELGVEDKITQEEIYNNKTIPNGVGSKIYQQVYFDTSLKEKINLSSTKASQVMDSLGHFVVNFVKTITPDLDVRVNDNYPQIFLPSIESLIEFKPKLDQVLADMENVIIPIYESICKENKASKYPNNFNGSQLMAEDAFKKYQTYMEEKNAYFLNIEINKNMDNVLSGSNNPTNFDEEVGNQVGIQFKI